MLPRCVGMGSGKPKTQLEVNLARNTKYNRKSFYRHIAQKRKNKEIISTQGLPPINKTGEQVITDMEKAEILYKFCFSFHG